MALYLELNDVGPESNYDRSNCARGSQNLQMPQGSFDRLQYLTVHGRLVIGTRSNSSSV